MKGVFEMKRTVKSIVAIVIVLSFVLTLAACGNKPSGTYGSDTYSMTFKGDKVTYKFGSLSIEGTFEMDGDSINITWNDGENSSSTPSGLTYNKDKDTVECKILGFTKTFEKVK